MNRNCTRYYLFQFDDGETISEKCRNSFGGFDNCMRRIADRCNGTCLPLDDNGDCWEVAGRKFTIVETTKEGLVIG